MQQRSEGWWHIASTLFHGSDDWSEIPTARKKNTIEHTIGLKWSIRQARERPVLQQSRLVSRRNHSRWSIDRSIDESVFSKTILYRIHYEELFPWLVYFLVLVLGEWMDGLVWSHGWCWLVVWVHWFGLAGLKSERKPRDDAGWFDYMVLSHNTQSSKEFSHKIIHKHDATEWQHQGIIMSYIYSSSSSASSSLYYNLRTLSNRSTSSWRRKTSDGWKHYPVSYDCGETVLLQSSTVCLFTTASEWQCCWGV